MIASCDHRHRYGLVEFERVRFRQPCEESLQRCSRLAVLLLLDLPPDAFLFRFQLFKFRYRSPFFCPASNQIAAAPSVGNGPMGSKIQRFTPIPLFLISFSIRPAATLPADDAGRAPILSGFSTASRVARRDLTRT